MLLSTNAGQGGIPCQPVYGPNRMEHRCYVIIRNEGFAKDLQRENG